MASINRSQLVLRTVDVERLIEEDHCSRSIWQLIGRVDLGLYHGEISAVAGFGGGDHTPPQLVISLWLYAYSWGLAQLASLHAGANFSRVFSGLAASSRSVMGLSHLSSQDLRFVVFYPGFVTTARRARPQEPDVATRCTKNSELGRDRCIHVSNAESGSTTRLIANSTAVPKNKPQTRGC